jgi:hypothetical protein
MGGQIPGESPQIQVAQSNPAGRVDHSVSKISLEALVATSVRGFEQVKLVRRRRVFRLQFLEQTERLGACREEVDLGGSTPAIDGRYAGRFPQESGEISVKLASQCGLFAFQIGEG